MINLCGGIADSLVLDHRSKAGQRNVTKELGIWVFDWFELSSVPCVSWLLLNTSLWEGFLTGGDGAGDAWEKTVTVCVTAGGVSCRGVAALC